VRKPGLLQGPARQVDLRGGAFVPIAIPQGTRTILFLGAALLAACAHESPPVPDSTGCVDVPTGIFAVRCANAGCHGTSMPAMPPNLDLVSPGVEARLVGKPSGEGCPGVLVDPIEPEESILYKKLKKTYCGSQMPWMGEKLNDTELACVRAWIET